MASASRTSAETAVSETGHGRAANLRDMAPADIWFLTVPDTRIAEAAEALARTAAPPAVAVHCSGFHTAAEMAPLRVKGWQLVSAHPNLSFADPETSAARFAGTPCGIEGDPIATAAVDALLTDLGAVCFPIASDRKALYHAAAVFSNNFATVLQAVAREAWADAGVPDDIARQLNASLLNATAENVARHGPLEALTGPAARGDDAVVSRQGDEVTAWHPDAGALYRDLSAMAARLKRTGKTR